MARRDDVTNETKAKQKLVARNRSKDGKFANENKAPAGKKGIARFENLVPRDQDISTAEFLANQEANRTAKILPIWQSDIEAKAEKIKKVLSVPTLTSEEKIQATEEVIERLHAITVNKLTQIKQFETAMVSSEGQAELMAIYGDIDFTK